MFKIRKEQIEIFRAAGRAKRPDTILADLQRQGVDAALVPGEHAVRINDARGYETCLTFLPDGLPAQLIQPSGARYQFEHDQHGRLAALTYPDAERLEMDRNDDGLIVALRRPELCTYQFQYDDQRRLQRLQYPDGRTMRLTYEKTGNLAAATDRAGATTRFQRDENGRLEAVIDPLGHTIQYLTDENGALQSVVFPDQSKEHFAYDPEQNVAMMTTRDGRDVVQFLDADEAVASVVWEDGSWMAFERDDEGQLAAARNATDTIRTTYDDAGNPLTEETAAGVVACQYDPDGRLTHLTTPQGETLTYEYDEDGRISLIRDWEGRENRIIYRIAGTIEEIRYGNGLVERHAYGRIGRQRRARVVDKARKLVSEQAYEYDLCERLVRINDTSPRFASDRASLRLSYDAESRVIREDHAATGRELARYTYDKKGNLTAYGDVEIRVGPLDEPLRFGARPVHYDRLGRVHRFFSDKGKEVTCVFADDGTLREAHVNGTRLRFAYDALGRRVRKTDGRAVWRYGWAGHQLLWEEYRAHRRAEPVRRDYLFIPGSVTPLAFREAGRTYWLQSDARGAVIRAFDEQGRVVWAGTYDSFGNVEEHVAKMRQPWRLVGHYFDEETGLHYNHARYYSPHLRAYLSRDPCWFMPGATNYSYARNDPWNRADPFGTIAPLLLAVGAIAVGAVVGAVVEGVTGGDPVAGALEGGLAAAGVIVGGLLGGPVGMYAGGVIGSGAGAFAGELTRQANRGDDFCVPCALEAAGWALAIDAALLGLGKVPGVKQVVSTVGRKLHTIGEPIRNWMKRTGARILGRKIIPTRISSGMKQKILYGELRGNNGDRLVGAHSSKIKDHPQYAVEVLSRNPDGTSTVMVVKEMPDGSISKIKGDPSNNAKHVLAPDDWSDKKIIEVTQKVGDSRPVAYNPADGATKHRQTVDGVEWEVIKTQDGDVVSSYPTGGTPSPEGPNTQWNLP